MNSLYQRIKDLADLHHISLAQVERDLNFSNGIISTWKTGKASSDKVAAIAKYFDVTTDYLLGLDDKEHSDIDAMTSNQKLIAYSIDPDVSSEERDAIIEMVKQAMKFRKRL
ncbi:helix-turn-helix domain-containing protein [Furfurilactobacillus siliginis]|uniref:HTH cro/C1-type domain-containing protein n=1 Tax=Furfurilactobacillus siliginis TaxID=348151 RepID=A0A0R2LAY8_9LACO|nr:helix-turn-helix transcriptional regulator [Furfurilactobacillus siliginis]KRN96822.1 hypothetical protein IV55_GL000686 [Furfurilactobacillus siliginis]GEK28485.1 hypothetical protein LSI01_07960 [Furfurilactobacillus siliginis]